MDENQAESRKEKLGFFQSIGFDFLFSTHTSGRWEKQTSLVDSVGRGTTRGSACGGQRRLVAARAWDSSTDS